MTPYYQDAACTIYHANCLDILPHLAPVDLVLTDPPYGIGESNEKNATREKLAMPKNYGHYAWDKDRLPEHIKAALSAGRNAIIFGGNYYTDVLPPSSSWIVWDKDNSGDFADCELAWTSHKKAVRKFKWRWNGMLQECMGQYKEHRSHPTQKPLALMKWCISNYPPSQTILDPFMGSGTTLRAAKDLNRHAIGIEISEQYCEIAARRLQQEVLNFSA
jgi:DNA modification methylase